MPMRRRWIAGFLAAAIASAPVPVLAASLSTYQSQAQQVASQLSSAQYTYDGALQAWRAALARLYTADQQLHAAAARLADLTNQRQQAEAELQRRQAAVAAQQKVVAKDQDQAARGLVMIDKHGAVSFIGVLLGSNSFADFLTRLSYLQKVWALEVGWLTQARASEHQLQLLEQQQQAEVQRVTQLQQQAAQQLTLVQAADNAAQVAKADADAAVARANQVVEELVAQKSALQRKIDAILAAMRSGNVSWAQIQKDIQALANEYGIDPLLVEAVVLQESGGNSNAKSSVGAEGLMQLMPGTAAGLGVNNPYDPVQNLKGGIQYLLDMLNEFHGNVQLALAAYNAGPYAVKQYGGIPPYQETQNYVRDVLSLYNQGK